MLDEPDASLDYAGEEALLAAIDAAREAGAVIVVATHRPRLLARMDFAMVLRDGRIESFGPHTETQAVVTATKRPVVA